MCIRRHLNESRLSAYVYLKICINILSSLQECDSHFLTSNFFFLFFFVLIAKRNYNFVSKAFFFINLAGGYRTINYLVLSLLRLGSFLRFKLSTFQITSSLVKFQAHWAC